MWAFIAYGRERGKKKLFRFSSRKKVGELFTFQVDYCQKERSMGNTAFPKGGEGRKIPSSRGIRVLRGHLEALFFGGEGGEGGEAGASSFLPSFDP